MNNYRYNVTGNNYANINVSEYGEYYDFLAGRERWLLDNPAMLLVTESPDLLFNYAGVYIMIDILFLPHEEGESQADYYRKASNAITSRYGLKNIGFMQQMVLCRDALEEDHLSPESDPDRTAEYVAGMIPLITNPIIACNALDRYRQYVKEREGNAAPPPSTFTLPPSTLNSSLFTLNSPSSIFQRIIAPYKGNTLFVDFWDMSCGPCQADMLQEREKVERLKDQPVRFLYICDEKTSPRQRTEKWLNDNGIRGEHIFVSHEEWQLLNAELQFNATPYNIGVDKHGNIVTYEAANKYVQEVFFGE